MWILCYVDESSAKRLEDEVQRYRDLLDDANRQIASMLNSICHFVFAFINARTLITSTTTTITTLGFCLSNKFFVVVTG